METEIRTLLDSRASELKKACSLRGFAERKDALCTLAREVLGASSLAYTATIGQTTELKGSTGMRLTSISFARRKASRELKSA